MRKYLLASAGVILADQLIKFISLTKIPAEGIFAVSKQYLHILFQISFNQNLAFGVQLPSFIIILLPIITISALSYWLIRNKLNSNRENFALACIIGAAISNLSDRFFYGGVVDFLSVSIYNFSWPSFNFADIIITVSAIYIIIKSLFKYEKTA
ncbi:MAG: signal peptidase II, partial [Patescibacteria group bacterium]